MKIGKISRTFVFEQSSRNIEQPKSPAAIININEAERPAILKDVGSNKIGVDQTKIPSVKSFSKVVFCAFSSRD